MMRCKHSGNASFIAALVSIVFLAGAKAQQNDSMTACLGRGGVTVDQRLAACSSIIEAGGATNKNLAVAYGNRGVAKAQKRELEGARKDYTESLRLDSSSATSYRFRGNLYLLDGDERKASEEFRKAIEIDPKLGAGYANLGMMAVRRGSFTSAIDYLDKSIEFDPDILLTYQARGLAKIQLDAYDQAIADFTVALKGPEPADALFGRGSAFAHKGEHEKALADYNEGLQLKSDRGEPFAIRCAIRAVLGQPFDEVVEDCDKAMRLSSFEVVVRNMRGFMLLKFDKPDRALKEFDISLRASPRSAMSGEAQAIALYGRGLAKQRLGDLQDGAKDMDLAAKFSFKAKQRAMTFFRIAE